MTSFQPPITADIRIVTPATTTAVQLTPGQIVAIDCNSFGHGAEGAIAGLTALTTMSPGWEASGIDVVLCLDRAYLFQVSRRLGNSDVNIVPRDPNVSAKSALLAAVEAGSSTSLLLLQKN